MNITIKNLKILKKSKKILSKEKDTKNFSCGLVVLKKGEEVGEHTTQNKEEIIVVLEGEVILYIEGQRFKKVKSNSLIYIPQNVKHNVVNKTKRLSKYIYITTQTP